MEKVVSVTFHVIWQLMEELRDNKQGARVSSHWGAQKFHLHYSSYYMNLKMIMFIFGFCAEEF